jgi:hypothetical protein
LSEKELKAILEALTTAHIYLYKDWTSEREFPALSEKEYNDLISRFENDIHSHFNKRASIRDY